MDDLDEALVQLLKSIGSALGTEALAIRESPLRALAPGLTSGSKLPGLWSVI